MKTFLSVILLSSALLAQGTKTWEQSSFDDFEKGTGKGVAIRSNGGLQLAPAFKPLITTPSTYIWSIASDEAGTVYAATGSPARVYRIAPDGSASIIFEPKELQVQAVVIGKDAIYAATSPDGKIYRIEHSQAPKKPAQTKTQKATEEAKPAEIVADPSYTSSIYFDPKTKYIWDLALDVHGNLYAATGDQGQIFKVTKAGEGTVFFKSDEAHIRVLALDPQGNLIAGSDGSGLIYRISPAGEAFVLYSANKKEITAITLDEAGNIYAAASGEKRTSTPAPGTIVQVTPAAAPNPLPNPGAGGGPAPFLGTPNAANAGNSEVYQIAPDGSPRRLWASHEDLVYALAFDQKHHLLAGTGNKGKIYSINTDASGDFTDLLKSSANQITGFAKAPNGNLYASSSNLGKIFVIGSGPEREGTYDSDVFDARNFSRWGKAEVRGEGTYELFARSGNVDNPDRNWSPWKKIDFASKDPGNMDAPAARFVQWRAVLHPSGARTTSQIQDVVLNYRPKNVAPVIDEVVVQPGTRFASPPKAPATVVASLDNNSGPRFDTPPSPIKDPGSIGVR